MEVGKAELVAVLELGVPAMGYEDDVFLDVLLDDEPGTATEAEAFALPYGVEPEALVTTYDLTGLDVDDTSFLLAHELTYEVVVVDLAEEADALAVLAVGTGQVGVEGDAAHLFLHQMADGEDGVGELLVGELCEEVGLVLDGVFGRAEPCASLLVDDGGGVVASGYLVVVVTYLLLEGSELDEAVAHDVGVGGEAALDAVDGIAHDEVPVFLLQVGDLEGETVFASRGLGEFDVFLGGAGRVFTLHAYLDVMEVGLVSLFAQLVYDYGAVYATGNEDGNGFHLVVLLF